MSSAEEIVFNLVSDNNGYYELELWHRLLPLKPSSRSLLRVGFAILTS